MLVFPREGEIVSVEWPFTEFGKAVDDLLMGRDFEVIAKEVNDSLGEEDENFRLTRQYVCPSMGTVAYVGRNLSAPIHYLAHAPEDYSPDNHQDRMSADFKPGEVTWIRDDEAYIPTDILIAKLADSRHGREDIGFKFRNGDAINVYIQPEKVDIELEADTKNPETVYICSLFGQDFNLGERAVQDENGNYHFQHDMSRKEAMEMLNKLITFSERTPPSP